ncbi:hypothetical protein ACFOEY_11120 [Paracandidimonas soli]
MLSGLIHGFPPQPRRQEAAGATHVAPGCNILSRERPSDQRL